jgi:hypothetical protein
MSFISTTHVPTLWALPVCKFDSIISFIVILREIDSFFADSLWWELRGDDTILIGRQDGFIFKIMKRGFKIFFIKIWLLMRRIHKILLICKIIFFSKFYGGYRIIYRGNRI